MRLKKGYQFVFSLIFILSIGCNDSKESIKADREYIALNYSKNILDYRISPKDSVDKSGLMFSDQGAWFAFGLHKESNESMGFSGPFLMTQQNGVWLSTSLMSTIIKINNNLATLKRGKGYGYSSHLEQSYSDDNISVTEKLVFKNGHSALLQTNIKNISNENINLELLWGHSPILVDGFSLSKSNNIIKINSINTNAKGYLTFPEGSYVQLVDNLQYKAKSSFNLKPNETQEIIIALTFIFPEYSWEEEQKQIASINFDSVLEMRKREKELQLQSILKNQKPQFKDKKYAEVLAKAHLTLQNNWRIAAGELKHDGLFPSYHYKWFNGFWSWDSWKHAVGLSYYDTNLAKNQMRAMFDFQKEDGFYSRLRFIETLLLKLITTEIQNRRFLHGQLQKFIKKIEMLNLLKRFTQSLKNTMSGGIKNAITTKMDYANMVQPMGL